MGLTLLAGGLWLSVVLLEASRIDVARLAREAPRETALMRQRRAEAQGKGVRSRVDQRWVPYERISPLLRRAVLIAEDDRFYSHSGFDWHEMGESARENLEKRRMLRGGSTITQQLAKNLYLGSERTLTRKGKEMVIAYRMEGVLRKRRILELYLNLIEWGEGIYGAEAAAQRHFGVPASALNPRQAALLAAVIINPRRYSPTQPNRRIERRAEKILARMARRGYLPPLADSTSVKDSTLGPVPDSMATTPFWPPPDSVPSPGPADSAPPSDSLETTVPS